MKVFFICTPVVYGIYFGILFFWDNVFSVLVAFPLAFGALLGCVAAIWKWDFGTWRFWE